MNGVRRGLVGVGGGKFGQGEETMANKRGGEGLGGGRWGSSGEKMGCDEWRETGHEPEKIGFQGAGRERAGCCKLVCPPAPDALTSRHSSGQINTCHTRN